MRDASIMVMQSGGFINGQAMRETILAGDMQLLVVREGAEVAG